MLNLQGKVAQNHRQGEHQQCPKRFLPNQIVVFHDVILRKRRKLLCTSFMQRFLAPCQKYSNNISIGQSPWKSQPLPVNKKRQGKRTVVAHCCPYSISPIRSFTTSPAMISPTTDGTKALLPGTCRRWVHLRAVPGGQMQWVLQLFAMSSFGAMGFSLE